MYEKLIAKSRPHPVPSRYRLDMAPLPVHYTQLNSCDSGMSASLLLTRLLALWAGGPPTPPSRTLFQHRLGLPLALQLYRDVYLMFAASAFAISTVVRSVFGAGLFEMDIYQSLNPRITSTILGSIGLPSTTFAILHTFPLRYSRTVDSDPYSIRIFVLEQYDTITRRESNSAPTY